MIADRADICTRVARLREFIDASIDRWPSSQMRAAGIQALEDLRVLLEQDAAHREVEALFLVDDACPDDPR